MMIIEFSSVRRTGGLLYINQSVIICEMLESGIIKGNIESSVLKQCSKKNHAKSKSKLLQRTKTKQAIHNQMLDG